MRSKVALIVLLVGVQATYAFDLFLWPSITSAG